MKWLIDYWYAIGPGLGFLLGSIAHHYLAEPKCREPKRILVTGHRPQRIVPHDVV